MRTTLALVIVCAACGDNRAQPPDACIAWWYADLDGDGFGDPDDVRGECEAPNGFVADKTDCDDDSAATHPGAMDVCGNGVDDDCGDDGDALCCIELDGWCVSAGPIEPGSTSAMIKAAVTFTKISGNADTRGGGACLVADLVDQGIGPATCTSDAECIAAAQLVFPGPGGFGYCAAPDGSGEAKRCWTRPGNFCVRSSMNPPGTVTLNEVMWDAQSNNEPVRWMLLACMAEEATPTACGGGTPAQYVRSLGPASSFP
ncbi:MAG: hypothetical protein ACKV2T_13940 [Kofleriaceae bacterium]